MLFAISNGKIKNIISELKGFILESIPVMVYVLDINGQPLMPTDRYGKVKHLLRQGKAVVVKRCPFTIRLLYDTTAYTPKLTLGVDTGSGTLGTAVSDEKGNIVYMSEVTVRNDITDKMKQRLRYRRNRRNRKNRYRKARYLNRRNSIKSDRFSPTMTSKFHSHIKEIDYIKSILSVKTLVLETGQFDTHLLKKPCLANPKVRHCTVAELILIFQAETKPVFLITDILYLKKSVSDGDFQQTKGIRSEQVINTGKIYGFRKFDKVRYLGNEYFIKGRMSTGYAVLMDINGKKADFSKMPKGFKTPKLSICRSISARKSQLIQAMAI